MAIADDFSIAANGDIRYTGAAHGANGAGYYTVIELHRWLGDLMDDAQASGNDLLDITDATASERATDNLITLNSPYNIDDTAAEHLYDGSIVQTNGDEIYDGMLIIAGAGMDLQIVQNGAIVATDFWNTVPFGASDKGLNSDPTNGISHRFMLKVRTAAADIDGRRLLGQTRVWGYSYSEFKINGTARGNNVMALSYTSDLNNATASATVATWTTIANITEGYIGLDVDNNGTPEYYYSQWNRDTYTINQFYERMKYVSQQGSAETLYGLTGELFRGITHEIDITTPTGTFVEPEGVSWGTGATAGTGQLLAIDSTTAGTKMWIQQLTGASPTNGLTITGVSTATAVVNGTPTERALSFPFCGVSTGTSLIGSYGFSLEVTDLTAADKEFDLTNTQITPPNYVTFTVSGLVSTEDRVLVGPYSGATLDVGQFLLNTTLVGAESSVVVKAGNETPGTGTPSEIDTPSTGSIRVLGDDGIYHYVTYTGVTIAASTMTFTGCTGAPAATANNNVFISYIDKLADAATAAFTTVFDSSRSLFVRVRDGGGTPIKTFESPATLGSSGGSSAAIRTTDA